MFVQYKISYIEDIMCRVRGIKHIVMALKFLYTKRNGLKIIYPSDYNFIENGLN